jgi:alpha-tubulin suppressor-like RCC1 family protein
MIAATGKDKLIFLQELVFCATCGGAQELYLWGTNAQGQLGDGTTTARATTSKITGIGNVTAVALGADFTVALNSAGVLYAWGGASNNALGRF